MKKRWKVFWIVCAVVSVIGLVCCAAAWGLGVTAEMIEAHMPQKVRSVSHREDVEDYLHDDNGNILCDEDSRNSYEGVNELDVDIFSGQVEVVTSADVQSVEVETVSINQKLGLKCYTEGNKLCIKSKKKLHHINGVGIGRITITVPEQMKWNEADFDIEAGILNIEAIRATELNINVGSGDANIDRFEADEIDLDCGAGNITGNGKVLRELDADCGVGMIQITLLGKETDYNYEIDCGVGDVVCGENSYSGLGTEKKIDNHASEKINIDCGVGSVELDFAEDV